MVNLRHKSDKTRIFVISDDTKGLFLFLLFFGSVVIWREIFVVFFWICWWEEIEFIWPTWIRHLILWVLFMPQNAGGDPIKGKFFIVLVIKKKRDKELKNPAWIYRIDHLKINQIELLVIIVQQKSEFIWSWIRQLFLWVLIMQQNVGRHQIKGKFVIVFIGKKELKIHVEFIDSKTTGLIFKVLFHDCSL